MRDWFKAHKKDLTLTVGVSEGYREYNVVELTDQERVELLDLMERWCIRREYQEGPKTINGVEIPEKFADEAKKLWKNIWFYKEYGGVDRED